MSSTATLAPTAIGDLTVWSFPVEGMTCAARPITVKVALTKTPGVSKAEVSYDKRQATVFFDDAKTNVATLTRATANAGYPSHVVGATP